jgi:putative phosphoribosyl transferase
MVLETKPVHIPAQEETLEALLTCPQDVRGVVLVIQGESQQGLYQAVIQQLQQAGFETLSYNLPVRASEIHNQEDALVAQQRLLAATRWLQQTAPTLSLGVFVTDANAASALEVLLTVPAQAFVAVAGRFDAAETSLSKVRVPTLLMVGSQDEATLEHNRHVFKQLHCEKQLADVPGATHAFAELGAIETIATLTVHWFKKHLGGQQVLS